MWRQYHNAIISRHKTMSLLPLLVWTSPIQIRFQAYVPQKFWGYPKRVPHDYDLLMKDLFNFLTEYSPTIVIQTSCRSSIYYISILNVYYTFTYLHMNVPSYCVTKCLASKFLHISLYIFQVFLVFLCPSNSPNTTESDHGNHFLKHIAFHSAKTFDKKPMLRPL